MMDVSRLLTRRQIGRLALLLLGMVSRGAEAGGGKPRDNGIGGTGSVSAMPEGREDDPDNGIGGTGVVGTIRDFGSIVVNDLHIAYPDNVELEIDGQPSDAAKMRVGHVVALVAHGNANRYSTGRIQIRHEVVGEIEHVSNGRLRVVGQQIELRQAARPARLAVGEFVAVSGLRLPDQTIVASLIEHVEPRAAQLVGIVTRASDGRLAIGAQPLTGVAEAMLGERIAMRGAVTGGVFEATSVSSDAWLPRGPTRFLVETYVERRGATVVTANGLRLAAAPNMTLQGVARAVISFGSGAGDAFAIKSFRPLEALGKRGSAGDNPLPEPTPRTVPSETQKSSAPGAFPSFDQPGYGNFGAPGNPPMAPQGGFGGPPLGPGPGPGGPRRR